MSHRRRLLLVVSLALFFCGRSLAAREASSSQASPAKPGESSSQSSEKKSSHGHDFLLKGTVFTNSAYAFPGVQIRLRRAGEKKFHWATYTNSRGEFAIRVPQGAAYELQVHGKGFVDQNRTIDAKSGNLEEGIVFRMQPVGGKA